MPIRIMFLVCLLSSCGSSGPKSKKETTNFKEELSEESTLKLTDKVSKKTHQSERHLINRDELSTPTFKNLIGRYDRIPFFFRFDRDTFFITQNGSSQNREDRFTKLSYGLHLGDELELLLPEFNKIGSPHVLVENCVEIFKDGKVGLYNFDSHQQLQPKFDLIFSKDSSEDHSTFCMRDGNWFQLNTKDNFSLTPIAFTLSDLLADLSFEFSDYSDKNFITPTSYELSEHFIDSDEQYLMAPSYLVYLGLMPDMISTYREADVKPFTKTIETRTTLSMLRSFIVSVYDDQFNVRDFQEEKVELISLQKNSHHFNRKTLDVSDFLIHDQYASFEYVNDTLVQVRTSRPQPQLGYNAAPSYMFYAILENSEIVLLNSNRIFDFTKYAKINEDYFLGTYASEANEVQKATFLSQFKEEDIAYLPGCYVTHSYLSLDDLDLMRNEIFAEYGYRFNSKKWSNHFEKEAWYKAIYDNVDHFLTEIDKHNIQVILEAKKALAKNEFEMRNEQVLMNNAAG